MGFPSPATDYAQSRLDPAELFRVHPEATFYLRCESNVMAKEGIAQGDIVVVDRAITPCAGQTVVAVIDGEMHIRRLEVRNETYAFLVASDQCIKAIPISDAECQIWGVITYCIKAISRC